MKIFEKQIWHLLALIIFLGFVYFLIQKDVTILQGSFWSISTKLWLITALLVPIIHQVYVLLCWRLELHYKSLSNRFGANIFRKYTVGFFILFAGRMVFITILAISNANTIQMSSSLKYILIVLISAIAIYAFYSVKKFFGMDRAAGIDHFDSEISKLPFVKKGIFKYTNNGMYTYAFLAIYIPALLFQSKAAFLIAVFSHLYIWVHYYFTEVPDIKRIYRKE